MAFIVWGFHTPFIPKGIQFLYGQQEFCCWIFNESMIQFGLICYVQLYSWWTSECCESKLVILTCPSWFNNFFQERSCTSANCVASDLVWSVLSLFSSRQRLLRVMPRIEVFHLIFVSRYEVRVYLLYRGFIFLLLLFDVSDVRKCGLFITSLREPFTSLLVSENYLHLFRFLCIPNQFYCLKRINTFL